MPWSSGRWTVKEGQEAAFIEAWADLARWSAGEFPGAHAWLLRDRATPRSFLSVGPWPDDATITAWRAADGFASRIGVIKDLVEGFEAFTLDEVAASDAPT
jgi:heme-degrading monooxygenase HmoA